MRFLRYVFNHSRGQVQSVAVQDTPFGAFAIEVDGEDLEAIDLGVVDGDRAWALRDGTPCGQARFYLERLQEIDDTRGNQSDLPAILDVPCTLEGIRARLRARGPAGIPVKVRAWLATILPPETVAGLGIARGLPVSALKACEAIRTRRDPNGGSRVTHFERIAERQHEARRRRIERAIQRKAARTAAPAQAAGEAWEEMRAAIARALPRPAPQGD
ncbi:MAG: hypothetical protein AB7S87_12870 [Burkholderiales bacterium]